MLNTYRKSFIVHVQNKKKNQQYTFVVSSPPPPRMIDRLWLTAENITDEISESDYFIKLDLRLTSFKIDLSRHLHTQFVLRHMGLQTHRKVYI